MTDPTTPLSVPAKLAAALVAAQAEFRNVEASAENPHFGSKYADLASILDTVRPVLGKHGLAVVQQPIAAEGRVGVRTLLIHASGEALEAELLLRPGRDDPQGAGSALTYARRYSLSALLGVAAEGDDDDANAATPPPRAAKRGDSPPASSSARPAPRSSTSRSSSEAKTISEAQRKRLWAITMESATSAGFDRQDAEERLRAVLGAFGIDSSKDLRVADYEAACAGIARAFIDGPATAASEEPNPFD